MKKTLTSIIVSMALFGLTGCGESGDDVKVMKVGIGVPESHFEFKAMKSFEAFVEEQTQGKLDVQIYASNQLGNDQEVLESIKLNTVQMNLPAPAVMGNIVKEFNILELPFIFPTEDIANQVVDGQWGKDLLGKLENAGYVGLGYGNFGFRHVTNSIKPITQLSDFEGLKLRTMQNRSHLDAFRALGSNPTPMPFSELFSSLQLGTVDGQENPFTNIYSQRLFEVQPYASDTGHVYSWVVFVVGKKFYDGLTPEYQKILQQGADIVKEEMRSAVRIQDEESLQKMIEAGVEFHQLTDAAKEEIREAVAPVVKKHGDQIDPAFFSELQKEVNKLS
ncbi:TRAP transporter substrate-binding protein [Enterovibrio sp. ZSDZ35]|uniref:TRAP transporter substrate-binding protein n=1 Tax=Enterovibrio qingdaonensis TaxID=2899818 RepID=A0ABT5QQY8_9GAMM|nr:TRAP transporter substrate-binding protein [Enterovibrio sp. ZSDZ35]MDD1783401.1 TRAP transporter substrate-binding protein [Enterovibrio sp. ZSDZ35]